MTNDEIAESRRICEAATVCPLSTMDDYHNRTFIAHALVALPAALDEIERLREALDVAGDDIEYLREQRDITTKALDALEKLAEAAEQEHCEENDSIRCGYCGEFTPVADPWNETICTSCSNCVAG